MSTVLEIKAAIERQSPAERAELDSLLWPSPEVGQSADPESPPKVREKLTEAACGRFLPGDRTNIEKILATLE